MIGLFIEGAIIVSLWMIGEVTRGSPQLAPSQVSSVPRTDEGAPIPFIYGRCRVKVPVLLWIGNWRLVPRGATAVAYELDMLFGVGVPFYGGNATLSFIYAGDFQLSLLARPPDSMDRPGRFVFHTLNAIDIYGGDEKGGGVVGEIEFFDGRPDQQLSDYIDDHDANNWTILQTRETAIKWFTVFDHPADVDETLMPGYRNQAVCLLFNWEIGETPNFTSYSFDVTSLSTGTPSDMGQSLAEDADPAAVIYDLLTSPWGKLGMPASKVDLPSFQAASLTLFNEGHGYSRAIDQATEATAVIGDVLRQIDGLIYEEPTTGKLVLKLIRFDYDVNNLDDVNPDNMDAPGAGWYQVQAWSETMNQVRLSWTDRFNNYNAGVQIAQSSANAAMQSGRGLRSIDVAFPGCCTEALAKKLASRELAAVCRPLVKATAVVTRAFYATRPGDVVTLTWPELGINKLVMRITRVELGQLHDGRIKLEMTRDVFDVSLGAFPAS